MTTHPLYLVAGLTQPADQAVINGLARNASLRKARYLAVGAAKGPDGAYSETSISLLMSLAARELAEQYNTTNDLPGRLILLYVPTVDSQALLDSLGSACFCVPVDLSPTADGNPSNQMRSNPGFALNRFERVVRMAAVDEKVAYVQAQVALKYRKSMLVLPAVNFIDPNTKSPIAAYFRDLQRGSGNWEAAEGYLSHTIFNSDDLPKFLKGEQKVSAFEDHRKIVFCPCRPQEMHGAVRVRQFSSEVASQDGYRTILNGLYRFGIPVPSGFHYDCQRVGGAALGADFICSVNGSVNCKKARHANIYPDDYVRA